MVFMKKLLKQLKQTGSTAISTRESINKDFMVEKYKNGERYVMPLRYELLEQEIAEKLMALSYVPAPKLSEKLLKRYIRQYEIDEGARLKINFHLAEHQKSAIEIAAKNWVFMLTGGPGMGKTCVVKGIISVIKMFHPGFKVVFCASTGKAARNLAAAVGADARTIQSAIGLADADEAVTGTLAGDIVVIDEVSMLDLQTFAAILRSIKPGTKLIIVGDPDQLPSVGEGAVLRDLMQANMPDLENSRKSIHCIPWEALSVPHRQNADSVLYKDIFSIRFAETAAYSRKDIKMISGEDVSILNPKPDVLSQIVSLYKEMLGKYGKGNVAVLTPFRKVGKTCANVVNSALQAELNPNPKHFFEGEVEDCTGDEPVIRRVRFCVGDPVMQLKNREHVSNGEVGKVVEISGDTVTVDFGRARLNYNPDSLGDLDLAYAMSVHKSQGSEYKAVITLALKEHEKLLSKNLVYTAITRAKKKCILICEPESFLKAVKRDASVERVTFLKEKLLAEKTRYEILRKAKKFFGKGGYPIECLNFVEKNGASICAGLNRQSFTIPNTALGERAKKGIQMFLLSLDSAVTTASFTENGLTVIAA